MNIKDLLVKYKSIFPYKSFNEIQEKSFNDAFNSTKSIIIKAPTGSGKTVIFELGVLKFLLDNKDNENNFKIIYIAPLKSLCRERYFSWNDKFKDFKPRSIEITGDSETFTDMSSYQFIYTTPEKLDCITRKLDCYKLDCSEITMVCIDEVHIISDETRGVTLEVVITRLKRLIKERARFIAVSASIGNIQDFTEWLSRPAVECVNHEMAENNRMVNLKTIVRPYPRPSNQSLFQFDNILNHKLPDIIADYSEGKPVLVFCITRKSTIQSSKYLVDSTKLDLDQTIVNQLITVSQSISDTNLRDCITQGIGYHHAGLHQNDRQIVENTFMTGILPILCSTSTLSMGINLPAHLVIIKGTRNFNFTSESCYTQTTLLQMIGRAGRPQFDTTATAVILSSNEDEVGINKMLRVSSEVMESHLNIQLTEHLNVEIVLGIIENTFDIESWITNTFLYIRCKKNPTHYGFPSKLSPTKMMTALLDLVMVQLKRLTSSNMVSYLPDINQITPTECGRLMARYFISIDTMESILQLSPTHSLETLIEFVSNCVELSELNLRYNERGTMNNLNKHRGPNKIRFPIKGRIISTAAKINCLIQVILGSQQIKDASLNQDADRIFRIGSRILRCMHDYLFMVFLGTDNYLTVLNCTLLKKCFSAKMWDNSWFISQQLTGIGPVLASYLTDAGLNTLNRLANADPHMIEQILHRHPPFGKKVVECASGFPKYELNIEQIGSVYDTYCDLKISVKKMSQNSFHNNHMCNEEFDKDAAVLLISDESNHVLLKTKIINRQMSQARPFQKNLKVTRCSAGSNLNIDLISESYIGFDIRTQFQPGYTVVDIKDKVLKNTEKKPIPCTKRIHDITAISDSLSKKLKLFSNTCTQNTLEQLTFTPSITKKEPEPNDLFTPVAKKPRIFSWKTSEIYKKSVLASSVIKENIEERQSYFFNVPGNSQCSLNNESRDEDIIPNTTLSYGREAQTSDAPENYINDTHKCTKPLKPPIKDNSFTTINPDLKPTSDYEFLSDDSFDEAISRIDFEDEFLKENEHLNINEPKNAPPFDFQVGKEVDRDTSEALRFHSDDCYDGKINRIDFEDDVKKGFRHSKYVDLDMTGALEFHSDESNDENISEIDVEDEFLEPTDTLNVYEQNVSLTHGFQNDQRYGTEALEVHSEHSFDKEIHRPVFERDFLENPGTSYVYKQRCVDLDMTQDLEIHSDDNETEDLYIFSEKNDILKSHDTGNKKYNFIAQSHYGAKNSFEKELDRDEYNVDNESYNFNTKGLKNTHLESRNDKYYSENDMDLNVRECNKSNTSYSKSILPSTPVPGSFAGLTCLKEQCINAGTEIRGSNVGWSDGLGYKEAADDLNRISGSYRSEMDYYDQGWEDLFDFIARREIIKCSKNRSSKIDEELLIK